MAVPKAVASAPVERFTKTFDPDLRHKYPTKDFVDDVRNYMREVATGPGWSPFLRTRCIRESLQGKARKFVRDSVPAEWLTAESTILDIGDGLGAVAHEGWELLIFLMEQNYGEDDLLKDMRDVETFESFRYIQGTTMSDFITEFESLREKAAAVGHTYSVQALVRRFCQLIGLSVDSELYDRFLGHCASTLPANEVEYREFLNRVRRYDERKRISKSLGKASQTTHLMDSNSQAYHLATPAVPMASSFSSAAFPAEPPAPLPWAESQVPSLGTFMVTPLDAFQGSGSSTSFPATQAYNAASAASTPVGNDQWESVMAESYLAMADTLPSLDDWIDDDSSGSEGLVEDIHWGDIQGDPTSLSNQAMLYEAYLFAKKRWRYAQGRRFRPTGFRGKGKGKGRKHYRPKYNWAADSPEAAYFKGKGKGKQFKPYQNPRGSNGQRIPCDHCGETTHWPRNCPKMKGQGKGSAPTGNFWSNQLTFFAIMDHAEVPIEQEVQSEASSGPPGLIDASSSDEEILEQDAGTESDSDSDEEMDEATWNQFRAYVRQAQFQRAAAAREVIITASEPIIEEQIEEASDDVTTPPPVPESSFVKTSARLARGTRFCSAYSQCNAQNILPAAESEQAHVLDFAFHSTDVDETWNVMGAYMQSDPWASEGDPWSKTKSVLSAVRRVLPTTSKDTKEDDSPDEEDSSVNKSSSSTDSKDLPLVLPTRLPSVLELPKATPAVRLGPLEILDGEKQKEAARIRQQKDQALSSSHDSQAQDVLKKLLQRSNASDTVAADSSASNAGASSSSDATAKAPATATTGGVSNEKILAVLCGKEPRSLRSTTPSSSSSHLRGFERGSYFPTFDAIAFHARTKMIATKDATEGLLVDLGARGNITGDVILSRIQARLPPDASVTFVPMKPLTVEGVGKGSQECTSQAQVPLSLEDGSRAVYTAPVLPNSHVPALLGLETMKRQRTIIDVGAKKYVIPGPGDVHVSLPPQSKVYDLVDSSSGHLLLPIDNWTKPACNDMPETLRYWYSSNQNHDSFISQFTPSELHAASASNTASSSSNMPAPQTSFVQMNADIMEPRVPETANIPTSKM